MKNNKRLLLCLSTLISTTALAHVYHGSLEVLVADDLNHQASKTIYRLHDKAAVYNLKFSDSNTVSSFKSGDRIEVDADKVEGSKRSLYVNKILSRKVAENQKKNDTKEIHTLLALVVNFKNMKTTDHVTVDDMNKVLYTNKTAMQHLFQRSSLGKVLFNQDANADGVPDNYQVNLKYKIHACDPEQWANDALQAVEKKGVDLSLYQHFMFVLPEEIPCSWAGLAHLGCDSTCSSWIRGYDLNSLYAQSLYAHEFAHNLGMNHSATDLNNDGAMDYEYGDEACIMGIPSFYKEVNAPHRDQMKWFSNFPRKIKTVIPSSTRYVIEALESGASSTGLIALRIPRNDSEMYYVSYRRNVGPFGPGAEEWLNKVSVHYTKASDTKTYFVKALAQGESLIDTYNKIKITVEKLDGPFATIGIHTA